LTRSVIAQVARGLPVDIFGVSFSRVVAGLGPPATPNDTMKLCLGALGMVMGMVLVTGTGCGPGLTHHGKFAQAPIGTTTLTSEDIQLPTSRMPVAREWEDPWADEDKTPSDPKLQTWGAPPNPEDKYGF
jgi:hypothetical protein